jgi:general secretion pathway protein J
MSRKSEHQCAGFTLVEVLLATVLMVIILTALATLTSQWLPNWSRGVAHLQRDQSLASGLDRVVSDIASAEFSSGDATGEMPFFEGSELSVAFVRTTLGPNAFAGLEVVRFDQTTDERGPVLFRSTTPFASLIGPGARIDHLQFSNRISAIRGRYRFSFSFAGSDRLWRDVWHGENQLPRAVRVRVRDAITLQTFAVSTSTPIRAELPPRCARAKTLDECSRIAMSTKSESGRADTNSSRGPGDAAGDTSRRLPTVGRLHTRRSFVDSRSARRVSDDLCPIRERKHRRLPESQ